MLKLVLYSVFAVLVTAVTFFGLGPVLFADGSMQERMATLAVVIAIYAILVGALLYIRKRIK